MKAAALVAPMIACAIVANILLKLGTASADSNLWDRLLQARTLAGLALFACSAMLYLTLLGRLPLNVAQSFMALQFAGVIVASHLWLGEALPPMRLLGVALITVGVAVVGRSS